MTALVLSSSTFFGPLSNKSLEVVGSTSVGILWILYPFEEGIGGSKILSLDGYSMLSRNKRRGFRIMVETDVEIGGKNYHEIVMEKSFLT